MLRSWKESKPLSVSSAVADLGPPWDDFYVKDTGLPAGREVEFVRAAGMEAEGPANYTIEFYLEALRKPGPLWIITGEGISAHARLLVGIYGNPHVGGVQAYRETIFEFIDSEFGLVSIRVCTTFRQCFLNPKLVG